MSVKKYSLLSLLVLLMLAACSPQIKPPVGEKSPSIRVLLASTSALDSLQFSGTYILRSEEARFELGSRNHKLFIKPLRHGLQLFNDYRNLLYKENFPVILLPGSDESRFQFRGRQYTGSLLFYSTADSTVLLVNSLPLEQYLAGVVPAEIITSNESYFEAVKAQAICARTYAIKKLEHKSEKPFDVYATVQDQVYAGESARTPLGDRAVKETRGIVLNYAGQPATVFYHSTCGGSLEKASDIFPGANSVYMPGGQDSYNDYLTCSASPKFRWFEQRSIEQMDTIVSTLYKKHLLPQPMKDTTNISFNVAVTGRTPGGRVSQLTAVFADTSVSLQGNDIRRFLGWPAGSLLASNLFYLESESDSLLTIYGGGYGHGAGMCQYGAMNLAANGLRYYHILNRYFPGTTLKRRY